MYGAEKNDIEMSYMLLIHLVSSCILKKESSSCNQSASQSVSHLNGVVIKQMCRPKVDRGVKLHTFLSDFMACIVVILTHLSDP